ncbi:MAG: hypothetical protein F2673_03690 [Actinobacteria bacterium]|nr:hypothetical protein [Actinomycetota bacterium]MSY12214.1 hypothetical protein [Actinomycetota bacterium]MSZ04358.1 hypothetical protein [Actinomycetota bacterium]
MDRATTQTRLAVTGTAHRWDDILEYDFGDLGQVRRSVIEHSDTEFVGFLDGDDLFGSKWISHAMDVALRQADSNWVAHPRYAYYFHEDEFLSFNDRTVQPWDKKNFFFEHISSTSKSFDPRVLLFNNVFTSNHICPRQLLEQYQYKEVDATRGFGVEDWTWNALTTWSGVRHLSIADTVHLVRVKESGSLGKLNASLRLLPDLDLGRFRQLTVNPELDQPD